VMVGLLWFAGPLRALLTYDRSNFLAADINAVACSNAHTIAPIRPPFLP